MFPDLSRDACRAQLEPFHEQFIAAITEGVRRFHGLDRPTHYVLSKRTRAKRTAIWAFIMNELETRFPGVEGLRLVDKYDTLEIHVGVNLVARVKRMDAKGFTSNYMTSRVTAYHSEDQGELFEILWARPLRVDIGYVEDELGINVAKILVARRRAPTAMAWIYEMTEPAVVVAMPVAQAATAEASVAVAQQRDSSVGQSRVVARKIDRETHTEAQGTDG